jgi:hypothetical protein
MKPGNLRLIRRKVPIPAEPRFWQIREYYYVPLFWPGRYFFIPAGRSSGKMSRNDPEGGMPGKLSWRPVSQMEGCGERKMREKREAERCNQRGRKK